MALSLLLVSGCKRETSFHAENLHDKNLIIIVVDTLRKDYLGAYDSSVTTSPCIDSLAGESFCFHQAVSAASWTKPSVASLMTGLYPSRHGAVGQSHGGFCQQAFLSDLATLDPSHVTLAEALKQNGFSTAAFITNPNLIREYNFDQGFDTFVQPAGNAEELFERANDWIAQQEKDERFFLYLHVIDPHMPYYPPEGYEAQYVNTGSLSKAPFAEHGDPFEVQTWLNAYKSWKAEGKDEPFRFDYEGQLAKLQDMVGDDICNLTADQVRARLFLDFQGPDDPELVKLVSHLTSLYQSELSYTDAALHRFLGGLQHDALLDESVIVFTGDHGEGFLEHDMWGHGSTVHGEEINIPLIFRVPGVTNVSNTSGVPGTSNVSGATEPIRGSYDQPVSMVDLYPTIMDLFGLPMTGTCDGRSLWPVIQDPDRSDLNDRCVFSETYHEWGDQVAVVSKNAKLIRFIPNEGAIEWRFYNLDDDPLEEIPLTLEEGGQTARNLKKLIEENRFQRPVRMDGIHQAVVLPEETLHQMKELGYL